MISLNFLEFKQILNTAFGHCANRNIFWYFAVFLEQFLPNLGSADPGENYFDRVYQMLYLVVKGTTPVEVHTATVIFVSFQLPAVTEDDFFSSLNLVRNLALFLKISSDKIRVSRIMGASLRRKRSVGRAVELEIGAAPAWFLSNSTTGMGSGLWDKGMSLSSVMS